MNSSVLFSRGLDTCPVVHSQPASLTAILLPSRIRAALDRSPMYTGVIDGAGPRYCPSVEDKVVRFAERGAHQIFVEPEGLDTTEVYPNGLSTSLPFDVQIEFVRTVPGFEHAHITRPGYAIEYDYFDPREPRPWLETRRFAPASSGEGEARRIA